MPMKRGRPGMVEGDRLGGRVQTGVGHGRHDSGGLTAIEEEGAKWSRPPVLTRIKALPKLRYRVFLRSTARWSWALFIFERPLMFFRRASL